MEHFGSTARRQEVLSGHDFSAGLGFEFQAGSFRDLAAGLRRGPVLGHASSGGGFSDLAGINTVLGSLPTRCMSGPVARHKMSSASLMESSKEEARYTGGQ